MIEGYITLKRELRADRSRQDGKPVKYPANCAEREFEPILAYEGFFSLSNIDTLSDKTLILGHSAKRESLSLKHDASSSRDKKRSHFLPESNKTDTPEMLAEVLI